MNKKIIIAIWFSLLLLVNIVSIIPAFEVIGYGGWTTETISTAGTTCDDVDIAIDTNNLPHIGYHNNSNDNITYSYRTAAGVWRGQANTNYPDTVATTSSGSSSFNGIALDSSNYPHMLFYNHSDTNITYVFWNSTTSNWEQEQIGTGSLVTTSKGCIEMVSSTPYVVYANYTNDLCFAYRTAGGTWRGMENTTQPDELYDDANHISMELDSNNYPCISYAGVTTQHLYYTNWTGSSWQTVDVSAAISLPTHSGSDTYLTLDSNDDPVFAFHFGNTQTMLIYYQGGSWANDTIFEDDCDWPMPVVNSTGHIFVSFVENVIDDAVVYDGVRGGSYTRNLIEADVADAGGISYMHTALGVTNNDSLFMIYNDDDTPAVKCAYNFTVIEQATVSTNASTNVEENSATLNGFLDNDGGLDCYCGFWYSTVRPMTEGGSTNVSCTGTYSAGDTFTVDVTGLDAGQIYYVMAWVNNSEGFIYDNRTAYSLDIAGTGTLDFYTGFDLAIWDRNISFHNQDNIEYMMELGGIIDDIEWVFEYETNHNWEAGSPIQSLNNLTRGNLYTFAAYNDTTFTVNYDNRSDNYTHTYFLTKPNATTDFQATAVNTTAINVTWTKGTNANTTMVRRQTGTYPANIQDGTQIYNDTDSYVVDTGLTSGTTYYYRAWSFANWSEYRADNLGDGSIPWIRQWSDDYISATNTTAFTYNITVLNESDYRHIDMSSKTMQLTFYHTDAVFQYTLTAQNQSITIEHDNRPHTIRLTVNNTYYRSRVPTTNSGNITFIVPEEDDDVRNYLFTLDDRSGLYAPPDAYIQLFTYENTTQRIIHEEYFSQDQIAQAYLWHESPYNRYWANIINSDTDDSYGGVVITANDTTSQTIIVYPSGLDTQYVFSEIITYNGYISGTTLYVNYTDALQNTNWVNITVYEVYGTGTTYIGYYNSTEYTFQATYTITNTSRTHYADLIMNHDTVGSHRNRIFFYHTPTAITTDTTMEGYFTNIFGANPLGWVNTITFTICLIVLMIFAPIHAGLGVIATGLTLGFLNIFLGISIISMTIATIFVVLGFMWILSRSTKEVQ